MRLVAGAWMIVMCSMHWHSVAAVEVTNQSSATLCAEEDNINVTLSGEAAVFQIKATHPTYEVTTYSCDPDFTNCSTGSEDDYVFSPTSLKLHDDGTWVVWAYRLEHWWQPHGMTASVPGGPSLSDTHYIAVSKKISDEDSWPQFLVFYSDGNLRLIPHPPEGQSAVCFGSSVIMGPAEPATRPIAAVSTLVFDPADHSLLISYVEGGTARLTPSVDRTQATSTVEVGYDTSALPFATLRSMFVTTTNCDTAWMAARRQGVPNADYGIMEPFQLQSDEVYFHRVLPSNHNMSAPDITITMDTDGDGVFDLTDACPATISGVSVDASGCPPVVPGDYDRDGDVDQSDFTHFQACVSGPAIPQTILLCQDGDFDHDSDVDQNDFGIFQRCLSGQGNPAASNCAE